MMVEETVNLGLSESSSPSWVQNVLGTGIPSAMH